MLTIGIVIVLYVIMAIGCGIALIERWHTPEVIASIIVGIFWPILIAVKLFKRIRDL
jgi:hypothetical protein